MSALVSAVADEAAREADHPSVRKAEAAVSITDYDWTSLVDASTTELLRELAATHSELANLHEEIAFNKVSELQNPSLKAQRINDEGHREALIEKKWLLTRLLDARVAR